MMENGLEQLIAECAEAMFDEDLELCEARDFTVDPVSRKLVAREHGFAVISASRDDDYFRPAKADSKRDWRRFRKSGEKPEFDPNRKIIHPEVEIASKFGRIVPDNKARTSALKRELVRLGWEFRPSYGGYKSKGENAAGGEHTFIVYPHKYDHLTHRIAVGDFNSTNEERENWAEFKQEMLELGQRYRQVAVYFVEPLFMQFDDYHGDQFPEAGRHHSVRASDLLRRNGNVESGEHAGETEFSISDVRPSTLDDEFFTRLDARTGRSKKARGLAQNTMPSIRGEMSKRAISRAKRRAQEKRKEILAGRDLNRFVKNSFTGDPA